VVLLEGRIFQARANAALGKAGEATTKLADAARLFDQLSNADVPSWGRSHWSRAVLLSHTATAWLDLGDAKQAAIALEDLGPLGHEQPRRGLYVSIQRSRLGALRRDAEAAAHHAHEALDALPSIRSSRSRQQAATQVHALTTALVGHPRIIDLQDHRRQATTE
jgi:hypothetical protein